MSFSYSTKVRGFSRIDGGWKLTTVAGDTKAGTLIAKDKFGNKYYENLEEELPCKHTEMLFRKGVY